MRIIRIKNSLKTAGKVLASAMIVSLVTSASAYAAESDRMPPLPETTNRLTVLYQKSDGRIRLDGAHVNVYKVADVKNEGGSVNYVLADPYKKTGVDFEGMDASESLKAAKDLSEIRNDPDGSAVTSSSGTAVFSDLPSGMYLVTESDASGTAARYEKFDPFLVSLPEAVSGKWKTEVTAEPKTDTSLIQKSKKNQKLKKSKSSQVIKKTKGVKTWDSTDIRRDAIILVMSLSVLMLIETRAKRLESR